MSDDFSQCMLNNARKAARAVSRRYDRYARPFGVNAAQFSVLGAVKTGGGKLTSELAVGICMERTTMVRNLALLEKKGLVASAATDSGNGRCFLLTAQGEAMIVKVLPAWRAAQEAFEAEMGPDDWQKALTALRRLSQA